MPDDAIDCQSSSFNINLKLCNVFFFLRFLNKLNNIFIAMFCVLSDVCTYAMRFGTTVDNYFMNYKVVIVEFLDFLN